MKCPRCEHENPPNHKFCSECGTPLQRALGSAQLAPSHADLQRSLTESLEQQMATSDVLRVISQSPTDIQLVLDSVAERAARLCNAYDAVILRLEAGVLRRAAHYGPIPPLGFVITPTRSRVSGRAVLERKPVHVADAQAESEEFPEIRTFAREQGFRTILSVPLLREDIALGTIDLRRTEVQPFTETQIALLKTFANQAVIAIENVRLFTELQQKNRALTEALDQQTATSEILRVISSSPTDVRPVFDAIIRSAVTLCDASFGGLHLFDGEQITLAAHSAIPEQELEVLRTVFPVPPRPNSLMGRAILDRSPVQMEDVRSVPGYHSAAIQSLTRYRTGLAVPMLRNGIPIGGLAVWRSEVRPFTDRQIELIVTFADQAVIAIENVRLFKELEARNADLSEALEQQTATGEILRVISGSPTDIQPVFDAIVRSGAALCHAPDVLILIADGDSLRVVASVGQVAAAVQKSQLLQDGRLPLTRGSVAGRAFIDRRTVHVHDVGAMADDEFPEGKALQRAYGGHGTTLAVPLFRENVALGVITLLRNEVSPFSDRQIALLQTFADQAVIAIENVRLFNETKDALERQTATSEILQVISSSPTDVQPVFDAILRSGVTLCSAVFGAVFRLEGDLVHLVGVQHPTPEVVAALYPAPVTAPLPPCRALRENAIIHVLDTDAEGALPPEVRRVARLSGQRSLLIVPMRHEGSSIGAILVARPAVGRFPDEQIALLQTFADQAVIAIENVRLFTELQEKNQALTQAHAQVTESLEQQTATSEILRVISQSPTDVQPVFDTIVRSAERLCGGLFGALVRFDGELVHFAAQHNFSPEALAETKRIWPTPPTRSSGAGRAILERAIVQIPDIELDPEYGLQRLSHAVGHRSSIYVPMLRDGTPIGVIIVARAEPGLFSDNHIALLKTFADQAVIAIENVRLFTELQEKNEALTQAHAKVTEALDQQTATSEILKVISSSPTDVQPVFDNIVQSAVRLCAARFAAVYRYDGDVMDLAGHYNLTPAAVAEVRSVFPTRELTGSLVGRSILERRIVYIEDFESDRDAPTVSRRAAQILGHRSMLVVPMLRDERTAAGALVVGHAEPSAFDQRHIELLRTFADQAVIAIENVRLFKELKARTADLTRSVEQLTALGEVGRAVSSTLDLETVLTTIVSRAVELSGLDGGVVFEYDERAEGFVQRAMTDTGEALAQARRATRIRKGEGVLGRTAITLEPVQVADIAMPGAYEGRLRDILLASGIRAILAVPMVREGHLIGCLGVTRNQPGEFPAETIGLLRTFATQSALAIQNARLFRELADKSHQLEIASQHKSEFLANMSHELRTPLNAIIGFSEVLGERMFGELNEKQDEYLKDIHASGQHLLSLINDILDLSKIEAGRMELEVTDFDLPMTIDNALMLVRERAARRSIALHTTVDERLGQIQADERKIRQVLLNLLSNAIKFTPEGGRIDVYAAPRDGMVEVSVTDTGVGIAPEDQEAVFEEFRQVGTAEKKIEGTGLGLALSRKFIELHGGKIWVKSQVGEGSTFTFTVPVRRGQ